MIVRRNKMAHDDKITFLAKRSTSPPNLACRGILVDRSHFDGMTDSVADRPISCHQPRGVSGSVLSQWTLTWSVGLLSTFRRKRDSLARRTITQRNMRRQDDRFAFVYCARRIFWTKFELSELFEAYLPSRDGTGVERGAPGSGTPIGWAGPRSGGGSQVKIICWQVSTGTPPGTRGARAHEWAEREIVEERVVVANRLRGRRCERLQSGWKEVRGRWEWA